MFGVRTLEYRHWGW